MKRVPHKLLTLAPSLMALPALALNATAPSPQLGEKPFTYRETAVHDTLWKISKSVLPSNSGITHPQLMAALLRHNPSAFANGNIFLLKQGVSLTIPDRASVLAEDVKLATSFYVSQEKAWATGKRPPALYALSQEVKVAPPAPVTPVPPPVATKPVEPPTAPVSMAPVTPPTPPVVAPPVQQPVVTTPPVATPNVVVPAPNVPVPPKDNPAVVIKVPEASSEPNLDEEWLYLAGAAALLGVGVWTLRRRKGDGEPDDIPTESQIDAVSNFSTAGFSKLPDDATTSEAELKLLMAMAYRELKRESAAQELLREVQREGDPELRKQAEALMEADALLRGR